MSTRLRPLRDQRAIRQVGKVPRIDWNGTPCGLGGSPLVTRIWRDVTCGTCLKFKPAEPRVAHDTGIVQDAGGSWHVCSNGEEILVTEDREYALRALKRAIERELA